ncbi:hypothetical protein OH76DRAFT_1480146 [Lentinus brumalis]|uniref:Uncharacterized protein n=1 Tax=Lentinus brumalis TaxID=2498619 RepID=A0A371DKP8_9APHY|nr:hypothetical protein OH76DRAFT_1480146 [Polyporus brumalis]
MPNKYLPTIKLVDVACSLKFFCHHRSRNYWGPRLAWKLRHRAISSLHLPRLVLVDLPGVADSNAARSRIAGDYIQKCDHFWITAPITRAVNDKTAQELLGRAFRHQIRLDGKLDPKAFTFIATKCDDVSSAEIVRDLGLQANIQYRQIMREQQRHKDEVTKWKDHEKSANKATSDIQKSLDDAEAKLNEYKSAVRSALAKRKAPHALEANTENCNKRPKVEPIPAGAELTGMMGEAEPEGPVEESHAQPPLEDRIPVPLVPVQDIVRLQTYISELQQSFDALVQQSKEARHNMREADTQWRSSRKELSAFCSLQRSQYSTRRIQADFRTGLRELGVHTEDDLPVFTVSARDHACLSDVEESACFTDIEQTRIPALREWCHTLTLPAREKATHNLLVQLRAFAQSFSAFIEGTPGVSEKDRAAIKRKWESAMHGCSSEDFKNRGYREVKAKQRTTGVTWRLINCLKEVVKNCVCDLQDAFAEYLSDKCDEGEVRAAQRAVQIADEFAASMAWQSFRATLRRDGSYKRDLNAELTIPFSAHIAESYCELFRKDFFTTLEDEALETIESLIQNFVDFVPAYLRVRAKSQGEICMAQARASLGNIVPSVDRALKDYQPLIGRKLTPHVQAQLVDGYRLAMQETGPGSVKRQKTVVHDYVNSKKDAAFKGAAEVLTTGLHEAALSVEERLNNDLAEVSRIMEKNLAVLWEGPVDGEDQIAARLDILSLLDEISGQLDYWLTAKKRRDEGQVAGPS